MNDGKIYMYIYIYMLVIILSNEEFYFIIRGYCNNLYIQVNKDLNFILKTQLLLLLIFLQN